jgi:hypothetical protein
LKRSRGAPFYRPFSAQLGRLPGVCAQTQYDGVRRRPADGAAHLLAGFCPATLFLVLFQFAVYLGVYESRQSLAGLNPLNIRTLINYQALLVSGLTGVPLSYLLIRLIRHPRYIKSLLSQIRSR